MCHVFQDDEDVYVLSKISDVVHSMFGTHKEEFLPMFEQLLAHFVKLLVSKILASKKIIINFKMSRNISKTNIKLNK